MRHAVHSGRFLKRTSLYHFGVALICGSGLMWLCSDLRIRNMESIFGLGARKPKSSPLEGFGAFRAQHAETDLKQLGRREWWLWLSALLVTVLSAVAFLLTTIPSFFQHPRHFYEIRSDQARWGVMCLVLLFNGWLLYRQRVFRRVRNQLTAPSAGSLSATDQALKELARRLKKACRGSDFAVRLSTDDFLLVLPDCNLGEVKVVLNRLGALEMVCSGRKINLTYTTGWVDYQPGDMPSDLLKRAAEILHLYENAAKGSFAPTLTLR